MREPNSFFGVSSCQSHLLETALPSPRCPGALVKKLIDQKILRFISGLDSTSLISKSVIMLVQQYLHYICFVVRFEIGR